MYIVGYLANSPKIRHVRHAAINRKEFFLTGQPIEGVTLNTINLNELMNKKHTKVKPSKAVTSFVVGYYVDDDGFAVDASGDRVEAFPGELLLKKEFGLLRPYDKKHKGRPTVKLKGENGKYLGAVHRGNEMMRYLLAEVVVPNAGAGLCNLLRTLTKYRAGRNTELVVNDLPLVGLREFEHGLTPLIEKQEKRIKDGKLCEAKTSKRSKARSKDPKQRYYRPPATMQDVGLRTLTQDMCC